MVWLSVALGVAAIVIVALSLKIFIIKYSLKDVNEQAERKLDTDTNLLILLESGDRTSGDSCGGSIARLREWTN